MSQQNSSTDSSTTMQQQQTQSVKIPRVSFASLAIIFVVSIGSIIVLLTNNYVYAINDGQKVFDEHQFYRLWTSMFSVLSFLELGIMIGCFIWIPFLLDEFERKYGTLYTIYHFVRTHILLGLLVDGIFQLLFIITTMKNFIQISAGIFPYCLYMYMKIALQKPNQDVDYWFMPIKMKRWIASLLIGVFMMLFTPESQGCLVVMVLYIFNLLGITILYCVRLRSKVTSKSGPLCQYAVRLLEKPIPNCLLNQNNFYVLQQNDNEDT